MDSEKPEHSAKQVNSMTNPEQVLKVFCLMEVQKEKVKLDCWKKLSLPEIRD